MDGNVINEGDILMTINHFLKSRFIPLIKHLLTPHVDLTNGIQYVTTRHPTIRGNVSQLIDLSHLITSKVSQ